MSTQQKSVHMSIRGGVDAIRTIANEDGFRIEYGHLGINGTIKMDFGEARELMQAIYEAIYDNQFVDFMSLYGGRHEVGVRCVRCGSRTSEVTFGQSYAVGCNDCLED